MKAKAHPVAISEIAAEAGELEPGRHDLFGGYAEGLALYRDARWPEATAAFQRALTLDPEDGPSLRMISRCAYSSISRSNGTACTS